MCKGEITIATSRILDIILGESETTNEVLNLSTQPSELQKASYIYSRQSNTSPQRQEATNELVNSLTVRTTVKMSNIMSYMSMTIYTIYSFLFMSCLEVQVTFEICSFIIIDKATEFEIGFCDRNAIDSNASTGSFVQSFRAFMCDEHRAICITMYSFVFNSFTDCTIFRECNIRRQIQYTP